MILKRIGGTLLVIGIGGFVLPLFGMQFRLLNLFGEAQPVVGALMAMIGLTLFAIGLIAGKAAPSGTATTAPAARPAVNAALATPSVTPQMNTPRRCVHCGELLLAADRFCAECGRPAAISPASRRPCQRCGRAVQANKSFCGSCGMRMI